MAYHYQPGDYSPYGHSSNISLEPTTASQVLFYLALLTIGLYYVVQRADFFSLLPLQELLWNVIVYITPPSVVMTLDRKKQTDGSKEMELTNYADSRTFAAKGEAMRRILRLDGPKGFAGIQRPRAISGVGSLLKSQSTSPPGLGNWDNSCYQNSVIQGLASLPSVLEFLDRTEARRDTGPQASIRMALIEIINQLNDPENTGKRLWTPAALKSMSSWQQQDAQEYYSKVLDDIEREIASDLKASEKHEGLRTLRNLTTRKPRQQKADDTVGPNNKTSSDTYTRHGQKEQTFNPLEGLLAQRVGCLECGYVEGLSLVPFNCITLPLSRNFSNNVEDCLDDFTQLEKIDGVECGRCTLLRNEQNLKELLEKDRRPGLEKIYKEAEVRLKIVQQALQDDDYSDNTLSKKCQIPAKGRVSSSKTKQAVIAKGPESLVMHINRSVFDEMTGALSKNMSRVGFPQILDLNYWSLGSGNGEVEEWNTDPSVSLLQTSINNYEQVPKSTQNYTLRAVITHYGRHENGHYICYRQNPGNSEQWWRLSDDDVEAATESEVMSQGGVFMLFYTRQASRHPETSTFETEIQAEVGANQNLDLMREASKDLNQSGRDVNSQDLEWSHLNGTEYSEEPVKATAQIESDLLDQYQPSLDQSSRADSLENIASIPDEVITNITATMNEAQTRENNNNGTDTPSMKPFVPTMRTSGAKSKRPRQESRPGMSGISNMVVAN